MEISEIMTTDVVTVPATAGLDSVVEVMLETGVGSVIVTREDTPAGLVTETDVLSACLRAGKPVGSIPVEAVMTSPVKTIEPSRSVRRTAEKMQEHGVKKLPVMDGIELVGMITITDIVWHVSDLLAEQVDVGNDYFSEPI